MEMGAYAERPAGAARSPPMHCLPQRVQPHGVGRHRGVLPAPRRPLMARLLHLSEMAEHARNIVLRRCYTTMMHPSAEEIQARFTEILDRDEFDALPAQDQPVMLHNLLVVVFICFVSLRYPHSFLEFPLIPLTPRATPGPTLLPPAFIHHEHWSRRKREPMRSGVLKTAYLHRPSGRRRRRRRRRRPTKIFIGRTGREPGRPRRPVGNQ